MATLVEDTISAQTFDATLAALVQHARDRCHAELVTLYPYDADTDSFYTPVAIGLPEMDVLHSLPDITAQLQRFRADEAEGKVPAELLPSHYGPISWLIAIRQPLFTAEAGRDVNGSFVRRHHIQSIAGAPLTVAGRIVGLLFLNYPAAGEDHDNIDVRDPQFQEQFLQLAAELAVALDAARHAEELHILRAISQLVRNFSPSSGDRSTSAIIPRLEAVLQETVSAARLDAAALYAPDAGGTALELVASVGCPMLATSASSLPLVHAGDLVRDPLLSKALAEHDLQPIAAFSPPAAGTQGALVLMARDPMVLQRRLPVVDTLLQTANDLAGAMLTDRMLHGALDETNRTLGAITRLSTRLLQPGATQAEVLRTAVAALTDPTLPELDFEFANLFLLERDAGDSLTVAESAGATASPAIVSIPAAGDISAGVAVRRVPTWAASGGRALDRRDVLTYVALRRRSVVVAALDAKDPLFVNGYPEDRLERLDTPIQDEEGSHVDTVHAARIREASNRAPAPLSSDGTIQYRVTDEFTLNADLFRQCQHGSLVRVFMPFGSDPTGEYSTGVLEAGYHISRKQRLDRVQIEALAACVATLAVAVETARLYEELAHRARQLEIVTEVSRTIATSIDLEQTLSLVARNMARAVDASICLIAMLEEDDSAWYGAASSDAEDVWKLRRVERPERSIVFEVTDHRRSIAVEDAQNHPLISEHMARTLGIHSLMALPMAVGDMPIGAVLLGQRDHQRQFTDEEVMRASSLADQAAGAIRNARVHSLEEEEHHVQKDVVLVGFGQWGRKGYNHLVQLKGFINFRVHVVEQDGPGRREQLAEEEQRVIANGDAFYWDSPDSPARARLEADLEPSCYVITYIATPAETHLPLLKEYYDLSNVVLIEKPLGAPPDAYRAFLESVDGLVEIVAADHYWFKIEVRLLQLLLTEERSLKAFLDDIEEVEIEILEEQSPGGSGAQIGMIADLIPHAFAILSLLTPLDRLHMAEAEPLQVGRYQPLHSEHETYARLTGSFDHRGRAVRVIIDVGKGVTNAKWIKLSGERRMGGRRPFYKFDFLKGEAVDGTQSALRAATRPIRQPGVPDNAHLSMLRHVIEKKHPAVGILSIREALRANARVQQLEHMAAELIAAGQWTPYEQGQPPAFASRASLTANAVRELSGKVTV